LFIDLTPLIPLSLKGEGEGLVLKGFHPFNLPSLTEEEEILERGEAPLLPALPLRTRK